MKLPHPWFWAILGRIIPRIVPAVGVTDTTKMSPLRNCGRRGWLLLVLNLALLGWFALTLAGLAAPASAATIAGGWRHSLGVRSDGGVYAWGDNHYGQIAVPAAAQSGTIAVAAGSAHSLTLKADGSVVAWGNNTYSQSTVPAAAQSGVVAVAAGG